MAFDGYAAAGLSGQQVMDFAAKVNVWPNQARDLLEAVVPLITARVREQVAEEIAQAIETHGVGTVTGMQRQAAAIARAHRTTPDPGTAPEVAGG